MSAGDLVSGEIKHTATPWRVGELNMNAIEIKHDDDSKGAMSLVLARVVARPTWIAEAEANAKFIVRACNRDHAFDDLVAALESALRTAEFEKHAFRPWHDDAREALAKAGANN